MIMSRIDKIVLVASRDPQQAALRVKLLEEAGFEVRSALDPATVSAACSEGKVLGVVIGWSVPTDQKRRVWNMVRASCGPDVPVVELLRGGKTELFPDRALFTHEWEEARFAETVQNIFRPN